MGYVLPQRPSGIGPETRWSASARESEIRMTVTPMTRWRGDGWRWTVRQGFRHLGGGWKRYEADAWVAARAVVQRRLSEIAQEQDATARTRTETIKP